VYRERTSCQAAPSNTTGSSRYSMNRTNGSMESAIQGFIRSVPNTTLPLLLSRYAIEMHLMVKLFISSIIEGNSRDGLKISSGFEYLCDGIRKRAFPTTSNPPAQRLSVPQRLRKSAPGSRSRTRRKRAGDLGQISRSQRMSPSGRTACLQPLIPLCSFVLATSPYSASIRVSDALSPPAILQRDSPIRTSNADLPQRGRQPYRHGW
jgi:hypothetical protein